MKILSIIKIFIILLALTLLIYFFVSQNSLKHFQIASVTRMDLVQKITIAGNVEPEKKNIITAPFNGYVQKLYVKIGDQVKKNDPIISVTESLQSFNPVYPIRALFAGTVVQILKEEGEFVQESNTENYLVRIDKLDKLFIEFNVPEIYRLKIKTGQKAIIKLSAILDQQYEGIIKSVFLAANHQVNWRNNTNVEFLSRMEILDIDDRIKPGMSAVIDIETFRKEQVLTLPHQFIFKKDNDFFVITEENQKKAIQVGVQNDSYFEIVAGLKEGDQVKQVDFVDIINQ